MANKIQIKRGLKAQLPVLSVGEPGYATDTKEFFIGNASGGNTRIPTDTDYVRAPGYAAAGGSANVYTATLSPAPSAYVEGMAVAIKINIANTAGSTINLNGLGPKSILDSKGAALTSGKLVVNGIYTLRYNGTAFILQGEGGGEGTAVAADILSGKTATTDTGLITGTMPNRGAVTFTPGKTDQVIADGYHNGAGIVKGVPVDASKVLSDTTIAGTLGTMPNNGPLNYNPSSSDQVIPAGYTSGGVIKGGLLAVGNARGADVRAGRTFSNSSESNIPGTATELGQLNITPGQAPIYIPKGFTDGGWVAAVPPSMSYHEITVKNLTQDRKPGSITIVIPSSAGLPEVGPTAPMINTNVTATNGEVTAYVGRQMYQGYPIVSSFYEDNTYGTGLSLYILLYFENGLYKVGITCSSETVLDRFKYLNTLTFSGVWI